MSLLRQVKSWIFDSNGNNIEAVSPTVPALQVALRDSDGNDLSAVDASTPVLKIAVHDGLGNPISSLMGALDIHDADVHRAIVNQHISRPSGVQTTLDSAATAGDTQIVVASAAGFSAGDYIQLESSFSENSKPIITAVVGTTITLNRPLDYSHSIGDTVDQLQINMNLVGTIASPLSFKIAPKAGEIFHLTRILGEMTHTSAGDNGLFGDIGALTNGVVLRRYDGTSGVAQTFTNWRTNSDIVTDMYDVTYAPRSGGGGAYGTNFRGTFKDTGAIVYLDGDAGDYLEFLIQDDLSGLDSFRVKAQGHFEG